MNSSKYMTLKECEPRLLNINPVRLVLALCFIDAALRISATALL